MSVFNPGLRCAFEMMSSIFLPQVLYAPRAFILEWVRILAGLSFPVSARTLKMGG